MNIVFDQFPAILAGFRQTLILTGISALFALLIGTVIGVWRVGPLAPLRWAGRTYVTIVRNTPLTLMFFIVVFGLPEVGLRFSFFVRAVIALSIYTAAFVAEILRSGVNAVPTGQAEAARALGMTFLQTLRNVVLPQSFRAVVPPLGSLLIALVKNTAIAEAFGLTEATGTMSNLIRDHANALYPIFFGIAFGYVAITLIIAGLFRFFEQKVAITP
jgi:glutamate transport system permease protein